jgi:hypothetical protein
MKNDEGMPKELTVKGVRNDAVSRNVGMNVLLMSSVRLNQSIDKAKSIVTRSTFYIHHSYTGSCFLFLDLDLSRSYRVCSHHPSLILSANNIILLQHI